MIEEFEKKYPILFQKNILGSSIVGIYTPIVVFLMDRIMISDNRVTNEESNAFDDMAIKYSELFGFDPASFQSELIRIGTIYSNFIATSEDARMTSEAIEFVANEFTNEQKLAVIDIIEKLAISDLIINNKELSLLFSVIEACYEEKAKIIKIFTDIYERIVKAKDQEHQMAKAVIFLINLIQEDPKNVKLTILGKPDPQIEGNIPPIHLTDEEFADWTLAISFLRSSKYKNSKMHQTRVYWNIGKTADGRIIQSQKGLIKLFNPKSSEDNQFDESISFTRQWVKAIRDGIGNVKMVDETIFQIIIFGDEDDIDYSPNFTKKDIWKITCKKINSGYEVHAFDFSDDKKTYWCPEEYKELSKIILSDEFWVNGQFPNKKSLRDELIMYERKKYDN